MTRARLGAVLALLAVLPVALIEVANAQEAGDRTALILHVPDASLDELMSVPQAAALARAGGAGLMVPQMGRDDLVHGQGLPGRILGVTPYTVQLEELGTWIDRLVPIQEAEAVLVVVAGTGPSSGTPRSGPVTGVVIAIGEPDHLLEESSEPGSLTSDSTRRAGVVSDLDIAPTALGFVGVEADADGQPIPTLGEPIRIIEGPPPFDLYERYVAQRRMYVPIGTAAALYVTGAGLVAITFLIWRRSVPQQWQRVVGWMGLSVPMLAIGLLAAGHLPELSYASAVPMVAIVTVFGTMAFSPLERRDLTVVPAGIGAAIIAFLVAEALLGWSGMLTPLLGGSQLDGGRFFGLPNVAIGLLVGASMWVAQRTTTAVGFALTCGVALFAGLPVVGANLGGAVTLFAAAGLWLAVRERERLGLWMGAAAFIVVTVVGTAVILVSHAISPFPTHVTRFEEEVEGIGGVWDTFVERLQVGVDLIAGSPAALVPVVGIVVVLYLVLRPPPAIRETFARWPAWRDANLVIALAGVIAYPVNDSGAAAVGLAFGLALGGMLGVPLLVGSSKMGEP
ncbi:MAG: hypothetical protein ACRDHC_03310 [Actinomycetota bacterium]